jgi:hypothetical protein
LSVKVRANQSSHDLVRKKERRSAVIESDQVHMTIQILDFAQDHRGLAESAFTLLVTRRASATGRGGDLFPGSFFLSSPLPHPM